MPTHTHSCVLLCAKTLEDVCSKTLQILKETQNDTHSRKSVYTQMSLDTLAIILYYVYTKEASLLDSSLVDYTHLSLDTFAAPPLGRKGLW